MGERVTETRGGKPPYLVNPRTPVPTARERIAAEVDFQLLLGEKTP
jgi:hypothetical protein